MRFCPKCQTEKPLSEFYPQASRKDGYKLWCKICCSKQNRKYYREPENNCKLKGRELAQKIRDSRRVFLLKYLLQHPCCKCGEPDPVVLDFDHRDPKEKKFCVKHMLGLSFEKIQEEIGKCDVLCSNCHRRKTSQQFGFHKLLGQAKQELGL